VIAGFEILAFPCTRYKANYPIFQKVIWIYVYFSIAHNDHKFLA
jgi:hypothetical protein